MFATFGAEKRTVDSNCMHYPSVLPKRRKEGENYSISIKLAKKTRTAFFSGRRYFVRLVNIPRQVLICH
jgi:hypothetical protein